MFPPFFFHSCYCSENKKDGSIEIRKTTHYGEEKQFCADKGFAPLFTGHEPVMLLLHQSACNIKPSASTALASTDYKTVALLLC